MQIAYCALWGVPRIICYVSPEAADGQFQCMFIANIYRFIALCAGLDAAVNRNLARADNMMMLRFQGGEINQDFRLDYARY